MPDLPAWANEAGKTADGVPIIDVDADAAYQALLADLNVESPTRYWLETAYQCMKMDIQAARGFNCEIRIHDPGKKWAQSAYPAGKGAAAATFGREARDHYRRIRGYVPG
jgi:hypothetical protein